MIIIIHSSSYYLCRDNLKIDNESAITLTLCFGTIRYALIDISDTVVFSGKIVFSDTIINNSL